MSADGVQRAVAYITSMFSSYNGCRKYREDLFAAALGVERAPVIDRLRFGFNHPRFIAAVAARVAQALHALEAPAPSSVPVIFTAHSLPQSLAAGSTYEAELRETCALVAEALAQPRWRLAYQSNNASYGKEPWLGPDIGEALEQLAAEGAESVVVAPVGFVCDHLEVVLDLDRQAAARARELAGTVGTHPEFVGMVRELILERMVGAPRSSLGRLGPSHDICPPQCCLPTRSVPGKPALCGADTPPLPAREH
jgi:ferrochelatase